MAKKGKSKDKPAPRKKGRKVLSKRNYRVKLKKGTSQLLGAILSLLAAGVLVVSFIQADGILGTVNQWLMNYFGGAAFFIPFLLFVLSLVMFGVNAPFTRPHVLFGTVLLAAAASGLSKAGVLGEALWYGLEGLLSPIGAMLVLIGSLLIGIVVAFSLSIEQIKLMVLTLLVRLRKLLEMFVVIEEEELGHEGKASTLIINRDGPPLKINDHRLNNVESSTPITVTPPAQTSVSAPSSGTLPINTASGLNQPWQLPPTSILGEVKGGQADRGNVKENAHIIEQTLESFGISAHVIEVNPGPAVTQYALKVPLGTKLSKITGLGSDMALALAAPTGQIRIEAPIPGKSLVGIEVPNHSPEMVGLKEILETKDMRENPSKMAVALGRDVSGGGKVLDITKMPHLLIAGATGSGKSVCVNTIICSLLFRATPNEVKFILVDPKRVELTQYNNIPHLLTPVIVEIEKVPSALKWALETMKDRYKLFAEVGARNIESYNKMMGYQAIPYIVIIIDELADIMLMAPRQIEEYICRLAQMARATGIHLILATQRPSVDVITGLIKANIPARIAFAVSSMVDSRVIVDGPGAEKLLGRGDMLYIPPDQAKPQRIQGTFVRDDEINGLLSFIKNQGIAPEYTEEITSMATGSEVGGGSVGGGGSDGNDAMFDDAMRVIVNDNKASASLLQRKLSIGYARAARILDQLEAAGAVGPQDGSKPRDVHVEAVSQYLAQKGGS